MQLVTRELVFDNSSKATPMDWDFSIDESVVIPDGGWFNTGVLQLQLLVGFVTTKNPNVAKRNTQRFLNPEQQQIGHWAAISNGYVLQDDRIKYAAQQSGWSASIVVNNTYAQAPVLLGTTSNTAAGHAQGISQAVACGTARGIVVAPPNQSALDIGLLIPGQANCMVYGLPEIELRQKDVFAPTTRAVTVNLRDLNMPNVFSGVIWGGYNMSVLVALYTLELASTAIERPPAPFVKGAVTPAIASYTCQTGLPIPSSGARCAPQLVYSEGSEPGCVALAIQCEDNIVP